MAWEKPTKDSLELFEKIIPSDKKVVRETIFGCPVGLVNGNIFIAIHNNNLVLTLDEKDIVFLKTNLGAKAFEPFKGRVKKGRVVLAGNMAKDVKELKKWMQKSYLYTASLPPKVKKVKKKRAKK